MRFKILFSVGFSFVILQLACTQNVDSTVFLADKHYSEQQVRQALSLYQRAAFFDPEGADASLFLKISHCFRDIGDFERSIEYLDHAYFSEPSDSLKVEILLEKATAFIQTENYQFALIELFGIDAPEGGVLEKRQSLYLGTSYYGLQQFEKAEQYFLACLADKDDKSKSLIEDIFNKKGNLHRPNPKTAMWLSIFIPGAGQFYSGDISSGINSFILTGSFVALTFYLTKIYHPIDALLTALPWFQRYYQGGFGQAEEIALKRRKGKRIRFYNEILQIVESSNSLPK